jgi:recombination protein RecT
MSNAVTKKTESTLIKTLMSDSFKKQVAMALPKHLTPDRFVRIALTELRLTPKLYECDPLSFLGAIVQCSQLGLEPGDNLGRAYLIPFKKECQLIIGYRGFLDLARRSGQILSTDAQCIYENDHFEFEKGSNSYLRLIPTMKDRGKMIGAYAMSKFINGGELFEVMNKNDIDKIRSTSKAAKSEYSPWNNPIFYPEMARKTLVRRLAKYLPTTPELQKAITLDEQADLGIQDNSKQMSIIDAVTGEVINDLTTDFSEPAVYVDQTTKLKEELETKNAKSK